MLGSIFSFLSMRGLQNAQVLPSAAVKSQKYLTRDDFQKLIFGSQATRFSSLKQPLLKKQPLLQFMSDFLERSFTAEAIKILRESGASD